jgi:uncharacterized protein (DUF2267 family)
MSRGPPGNPQGRRRPLGGIRHPERVTPGGKGMTVDRDTFITTVGQMLGADADTAGRAVRATLSTLGERVGADEGRLLVAELPPEIGPLLYPAGPASSFDADEFARRVAEREQVDPATAVVHASAVLAVLARAVDDRAYERLVNQLSPDYRHLLPGAG